MTAVLFLNHRVEVLDRRLGNSESIFLQLMAGAPEWGFPLSWQDPGKSILFFPFSLDPQLPVIADHVFKAVVGVQAARAWQDPDGCTSQFMLVRGKPRSCENMRSEDTYGECPRRSVGASLGLGGLADSSAATNSPW